MKKIAIIALLGIATVPAYSVGRSHNVFRTHKMLSDRTQSKSVIETPPTKLNANNALEKSKEKVLKSISVAQSVVKFVGKFVH